MALIKSTPVESTISSPLDLQIEIREQVFDCVHVLPGIASVEMTLLAAGAAENGIESARTLKSLFEAVIVPEQASAFHEVLMKADPAVTIEELALLSTQILEAYSSAMTGRQEETGGGVGGIPFEQSSDSATSSPPPASNSQARSSLKSE